MERHNHQEFLLIDSRETIFHPLEKKNTDVIIASGKTLLLALEVIETNEWTHISELSHNKNLIIIIDNLLLKNVFSSHLYIGDKYFKVRYTKYLKSVSIL